jgi:hypothetical protein
MQLFSKAGGDFQVEVPRTILSMINYCGPVPRALKDIERGFLFEAPENIKPKDIVRHFTTFLVDLGFLGQTGDKIERISIHKLETWVKRAKDWLEKEFDVSANTIKSIHHEAGEKLLNVQAKDARDRLKRAENKFDTLSLDFIDKPWDEMNKETADGMPVYEQKLRTSLMTIRKLIKNTKWVYDPEPCSAFRYGSSYLEEFDLHGGSPGYPLWKRLLVLKGFYQELDKKRKKLIGLVDKILKDVDQRVPELDSGEKAFPLQPLTLPLGLFRKELNFGADKPEKTIAGAGTTLGVKTIGFKLAADQYADAFERLENIGEELELPGRLVPAFLLFLEKWEAMREEIKILSDNMNTLFSFFSDAPEKVRGNYKIDEIKSDFDDIYQVIEKGGIREGTDSRETAGTPVFQLIEGLKEDLSKITDIPRQIQDRIEEADQAVMPSLSEFYNKKYKAKLKAFASIMRVQGKNPPIVPDRKEETYGKTVQLFENFIETAGIEGGSFFAGSGETTFDVYSGFCQLELDRKPIDWHSEENKTHMNTLIEKRLLTLKLI